jgi:hypothetical protein
MRRKVTLILLLFFGLNTRNLIAQKAPNEVSLFFGGGFYAHCFQPLSKEVSTVGFGGDAGMGYTAFFSKQIGIHTGVGFGLYNIKNKVNGFYTLTPEVEDCEGYLFDLHTTLGAYKETHRTMYLQVPLMLQFQTKQNQSLNWQKGKRAAYYAMAGAKAFLHLNYRYTSEIASLNNAAYYPIFDNWIYLFPDMGIGDFEGNSVEKKLKINILAVFAFETGFKWRVGKNVYLYTGVYFDCGLHDPIQKNRTPFSAYTYSEDLDDLTLLDFAKKMNLMAAGVKLRLGIFRASAVDPCPYW